MHAIGVCATSSRIRGVYGTRHLRLLGCKTHLKSRLLAPFCQRVAMVQRAVNWPARAAGQSHGLLRRSMSPVSRVCQLRWGDKQSVSSGPQVPLRPVPTRGLCQQDSSAYLRRAGSLVRVLAAARYRAYVAVCIQLLLRRRREVRSFPCQMIHRRVGAGRAPSHMTPRQRASRRCTATNAHPGRVRMPGRLCAGYQHCQGLGRVTAMLRSIYAAGLASLAVTSRAAVETYPR